MPEARVADFRRALDDLFQKGIDKKRDSVKVRCGDLHDAVNHGGSRHPACSGVMWAETAKGACEVIYTPIGGMGTRLTIRYKIPRPNSTYDW